MHHPSAHRSTWPATHRATRRDRVLAVAALVAVVATLATACSSGSSGGSSWSSSSSSSASPTTATPRAASGGGQAGPDIVFGGDGNNLDAYATNPSADRAFATQRVDQTVDTDPVHGRDLNAQICFFPKTKAGEQWFIAGEDTHQDDPAFPPGWGIFRLTGTKLGHLHITQIGKLVPTFQPTADGAENYGCAVLPDGRVLTTDVGNQAGGAGDGQLIIWFPPFVGGGLPHFDQVAYCKLDVGLATAQSILLQDDTLYVAASRGAVYRYRGPFPTSADAAGGCGKKDGTGAPLADSVDKSTFIPAGLHGLATPAGLAHAPDGGMYVSSVISGVIDEFGPDGAFRRTILEPPAGEKLGPKPYSTGSPLGIAVDGKGNLFYADIGIVIGDGSVGPGDHTGTVRRIRFVDGKPQEPETMATGLDFPDGLGVFRP